MNYQERMKNIQTLFLAAKYLEFMGNSESTDAAEILYLNAAQQAEKYLDSDSQLRAKVLIGCIDFYDYLGRDEDSKLMQTRLAAIANSVLEKLQSTNHTISSNLID